MPASEPLSKHHPHNESDSESDSDEEGELEDVAAPKIVVDVDATKLTPLSPEVISKQVHLMFHYLRPPFLLGLDEMY
jgi:translation initiation factor 2 subunit 3